MKYVKASKFKHKDFESYYARIGKGGEDTKSSGYFNDDEFVMHMSGETIEKSRWDDLEILDEQADDWIDADITPPAEKQDCAFIVINEHNLSINGRVLGGRYMGKPFGVHEFAVPGHGYYARFWQPLPSTPQGGDKQ